MARLPTLDDLGSRPTPVSRRAIASNSRAGAVGNAVERLGGQISSAGKQMLEKEDKLAYSAARSAILKADVAARQELEDDPDFETWEPRYSEKMKAAREQASGLIKSRSDRMMFQTDVELDIARGSAELSKSANGRRSTARVALLDDTLFNLQDVAQNAPDDATREATINTANEAIQAAVERGDVDAAKGGGLRRSWTQKYIIQQIEARKGRGDLEGAEQFFEVNRGRIDGAAEIRLESQIRGAVEHRETLTLADEFVGSIEPSSPEPTQGSKWSVISRPGAARDGGKRVHAGYDIAPSKGNEGWHPTQDFRLERPRNGPRQGLTIDIVLADGTRMKLMHLASLPKAGEYKAGDLAAIAGNTGNAKNTPTHFHVEAVKNGRQVDPSGYFGAGAGGAGGPTRRDLKEIYASIEARADAEGWEPEKTERIKAQSARLVQREDTLVARDERDAFERAFAQADALGDGFTDVSQLGDDFYKASPTNRARLRNIAEQNGKPVAVEGNGDVIRLLHRMAIQSPDKFAQANLAEYRAFMTDGEYDEISTSQARAIEDSGEWSPRSGITSAMTWGDKFGGVKLEDGDGKYRAYRFMESAARAHRAAKGSAPSEADYQRFFREATREVNVTRSFLGIDALLPDRTGRANEIITPAYRRLIRNQYTNLFGKEPSEEEIQEWFDKMGEGF